MQNIIGKAVRPIESEAYEILRAIQAYEYMKLLFTSVNDFTEQGTEMCEIENTAISAVFFRPRHLVPNAYNKNHYPKLRPIY